MLRLLSGKALARQVQDGSLKAAWACSLAWGPWASDSPILGLFRHDFQRPTIPLLLKQAVNVRREHGK
jgi:hypothetical protein